MRPNLHASELIFVVIIATDDFQDDIGPAPVKKAKTTTTKTKAKTKEEVTKSKTKDSGNLKRKERYSSRDQGAFLWEKMRF